MKKNASSRRYHPEIWFLLVLAALVFALAGFGGIGRANQANLQGPTPPRADAGGTAIPELPVVISPFNAAKDDYVLLAWNDLGMHCMTDAVAYWIFLPPANTVWAQLVKRGPKPEIVTDNVVVSFHPEAKFEHPSKHTEFWKYAKSYFGKELPLDVGLGGKKVVGESTLNAEHRAFVAEMLPVVPYTDEDTFEPYPVFTFEARDAKTGELLATTQAVLPVSTEVGCRMCHGGEARYQGVTGMSDETAINILKAHDRINQTDLLARAEAGNPQLCQSCHADPALGAAGREGVLNLSTAMHGFHAARLTGRGAEACAICHPNAPDGRTRCLRGVHAAKGKTCVDCHGTLEDHALSLLKQEKQNGKAAAEPLMMPLMPRQVADVDAVNPRTPWINSPECLTCHVGFMQPKADAQAYNHWTAGPAELYRMRAAKGGVMCAACHGSPHAIYPADNPYGARRDNLQPLQYQGNRYAIGANQDCAVCHTQAMDREYHHVNMLRAVRNE